MQAPLWRHETWPNQSSHKKVFRKDIVLTRSNAHAQIMCYDPMGHHDTQVVNAPRRHKAERMNLLNVLCASCQPVPPNIKQWQIGSHLEAHFAASKQLLYLMWIEVIEQFKSNIMFDETRSNFLPRRQSKPQDTCMHVQNIIFFDNKFMHFSKPEDKHAHTMTNATALIKANREEIKSVSDMKHVRSACTKRNNISTVFWKIILHGESTHN